MIEAQANVPFSSSPLTIPGILLPGRFPVAVPTGNPRQISAETRSSRLLLLFLLGKNKTNSASAETAVPLRVFVQVLLVGAAPIRDLHTKIAALHQR